MILLLLGLIFIILGCYGVYLSLSREISQRELDKIKVYEIKSKFSDETNNTSKENK